MLYHFQISFLETERISRYDNSTYLLLASGNSVKIDSNNSFLESNVSEGWITQNNNFVLTSLNDENHFLVKVNTSSGKTFNKVFTIDKKIAGIYVVGNTLNRIILDLQLFLQENPISIERLIVSIDFNERGIGDILLSKKVPDCYYVLSNKDLDVGYNGIIYSMITSPRGVNVFALNETKEIIVNDYPRFLLDIKYHFNDHLIKVDINH